MSRIKLFCFATHNHKLFFSNLPHPYHLKKGQNPYWIRTICTRWHICTAIATVHLTLTFFFCLAGKASSGSSFVTSSAPSLASSARPASSPAMSSSLKTTRDQFLPKHFSTDICTQTVFYIMTNIVLLFEINLIHSRFWQRMCFRVKQWEKFGGRGVRHKITKWGIRELYIKLM